MRSWRASAKRVAGVSSGWERSEDNHASLATICVPASSASSVANWTSGVVNQTKPSVAPSRRNGSGMTSGTTAATAACSTSQ
jgi:hypothetical protein